MIKKQKNIKSQLIEISKEIRNDDIDNKDLKDNDNSKNICTIKFKNKKNIIKFIMVIPSILLIISIINLIRWFYDNKKTEDIMKDIEDSAIIQEVIENTDNENIEIIEQEEMPYENPYWDYIKMNLITVDFKELKNKNSNIVGWIQVNGTNINYPFVQTNDNEYYLNHSLDGSYNDAGWVFLDYRNNLDKNDKNTIIYAHSRFDLSMFGSLKNILTNGWLDNQNNYIVKLSTEYENTLWQVFSVYRIPTTSDYLNIKFTNSNHFNNWVMKLIGRSFYNFNTEVNENDRILTLSTCYNNEEKVVLHAKLIKKERR